MVEEFGITRDWDGREGQLLLVWHQTDYYVEFMLNI